MPIHDWTKVESGTFHDFHQGWIVEIRTYLNNGALPEGYYAMAEQVTRPFGPDVLTLQSGDSGFTPGPTTVALLEKPPKVRYYQESDADLYAKKADRVAIRHVSDDRIVAILEVLSPGNKSSRHGINAFLAKVESALAQGIHLLLVDLFPPTRRDPGGIHCLIWGDGAEPNPEDHPLTLIAYVAGEIRKACVEPTRVGAPLTEMPLFLDELNYVPIPLEATYQAAWRGLPQKSKIYLES